MVHCKICTDQLHSKYNENVMKRHAYILTSNKYTVFYRNVVPQTIKQHQSGIYSLNRL